MSAAKAEGHASALDLARFSNRSLLDALERRGAGGTPLGGASNEAIFDELADRGADLDSLAIKASFDLTEAAARFRRGEIADALHHLERALPPEFAGLARLAESLQPKAAA